VFLVCHPSLSTIVFVFGCDADILITLDTHYKIFSVCIFLETHYKFFQCASFWIHTTYKFESTRPAEEQARKDKTTIADEAKLIALINAAQKAHDSDAI